MSNLHSASTNIVATPAKHLLDVISAIRTEVGDGLKDDEFTRLLRQSELPNESGFAFLSYCDRLVMLTVPKQKPTDWYPEKGWLSAAKKNKAREIADKYALSVCEPPDMIYPGIDMPTPHHHLELSNGREAIIIAHPDYLKVRLFVATSSTRTERTAQKPLLLGPDLLPDLAALYQA